MREAAKAIRKLPGVKTLGVVGVSHSGMKLTVSIAGAQTDSFLLQTWQRTYLMHV
jgi:hypothetical protein